MKRLPVDLDEESYLNLIADQIAYRKRTGNNISLHHLLNKTVKGYYRSLPLSQESVRAAIEYIEKSSGRRAKKNSLPPSTIIPASTSGQGMTDDELERKLEVLESP